MQMIETLRKIISTAVGSCIQARSDSEVRMVLRGLPSNVTDSLLGSYIASGGVQISGHDLIRVLCVSDQNETVEDSICGKCTGEDVVNSRNVRQAILILLPNGRHIPQSVVSSVSFIGLDPQTISGIHAFSDDPFIDHLLGQLQGQLNLDSTSWEQARKALASSFKDRSARGDVNRSTTSLNECWALLAALFGVKNDFDLFLARCGLPRVMNGEIGTEKHLEVLKDLAKFIESNGFGAAMETLIGEADEHLHPHLRSFFDHLSVKGCDSPPDFSISPAYYYSQDQAPEAWWHALDLDVWLTLLQSIGRSGPSQGRLEVECLNPITPHKVKGLPFVVEKAPCFKVVADDTRITVYRGQGRTPKEEAVINVGDEWTPEEVPLHGNSINYRFVADDYRDGRLDNSCYIHPVRVVLNRAWPRQRGALLIRAHGQ